jgi:uncharacterized membrane protein (DUF485 family)
MSTDAPEHTPFTDKAVEVAATAEFDGLRRALRRFVFPMTIAFFTWYALYVLLSAYARDFMSIKVIGNINVALIFGLLQFVTTFLIAWLYSRYADRRLDPVATTIRERLQAEATAAGTVNTDVEGENR